MPTSGEPYIPIRNILPEQKHLTQLRAVPMSKHRQTFIVGLFSCALVLGQAQAESDHGTALAVRNFVMMKILSAKRVYRLEATAPMGLDNDLVATAAYLLRTVVSQCNADLADVNIMRSDLSYDTTPLMFMRLAEGFYDPSKVPAMEIFVYKPTAPREVAINNDFHRIYGQLLDRGMNDEKADQIAGQQIQRKYHLKPNWSLPAGNLSGGPVDAGGITIDEHSMQELGIESVISSKC